jgi:hypothetical protein
VSLFNNGDPKACVAKIKNVIQAIKIVGNFFM